MKARQIVTVTWMRLWPQFKTLPLVLVEGLLGVPVYVFLPMVQYTFSAVLCRLFSVRAERASFAEASV